MSGNCLTRHDINTAVKEPTWSLCRWHDFLCCLHCQWHVTLSFRLGLKKTKWHRHFLPSVTEQLASNRWKFDFLRFFFFLIVNGLHGSIYGVLGIVLLQVSWVWNFQIFHPKWPWYVLKKYIPFISFLSETKDAILTTNVQRFFINVRTSSHIWPIPYSTEQQREKNIN